MATGSGLINGSFNGTYPNYMKPQIYYEYTHDTANCRSSVTTTFRVYRVKSGSTTYKASAAWWLNSAGNNTSGTVKFNIQPVSVGGTTSIASKTVTVSHNTSTGAGSAAASAQLNLSGTSAGYGKVSGTMSLGTIAVAPAFTEHYVAATGTNSITIQWGADRNCDAVQYSLNGGAWTDISGYPQYTIYGLAANTYYTVNTRIRGTDSQQWTAATALGATTQQATPSISSFTVSGRTSSSITCSFAVDGCQTWYYKLSTQSNWTQASNASSRSFTITGLAANTTYTINLICRNWINQSAGTYKDGTANVSGTTHQTTVASISLSSRTSSSITVSSGCNVAVSSTHYRIAVSGGGYGNWQTSATFTGLAANTTYTVQVQKVGQASGEAGYATVSATTHQTTVASISLSSKTVNSIAVSSGCNVTASATYYRIKVNGGSYGGWQTGASFGGLGANTTYVIQVQKVGQASGESGYAELTVATYNNATITSTSGFSLGGTHTVNYSNPAGNNVSEVALCLSFTGAKDDVPYRAVSRTGTSYTYTFTDAELDTLYKQMGTGNSITLDTYVRTSCNGTLYYSTQRVTVTLTGDQKTNHLNVSNSWKRAKGWINVGGSQKRCVSWVNVNGTWKRTI